VAKRNLTTDEGDISSDSLCTPPEITVPLYELWGGPPLCDPCSNEHAIVKAKHVYTFGGLHRRWYDTTYMNQPYSTNGPWIDKAVYEMKLGHVSELVILCMTATSTTWWRNAMVKPRRNPRVICTRRIAFWGPNGKPLKHGARFDTSLIYYGKHVKKFDRLFKHVARWSTWGR
jgi:DNA N-6-adenine-methyltransferase (Dam)